MQYSQPVIVRTSTTSKILSQIPGNSIISFLVIFQLITMLACYFIAVGLGHVKPWLPMISDCGCRIPETWLFRIGFITVAAMMAISSITFRDFVNNQLDLNKVSNGRVRATNNILIYICVPSCCALAGLSSVNEKESNSLHGIFAVTFFILYLIYMIVLVLYLRNNRRLVGISDKSLLVKEIVVFLCAIDLICFAVMSSNWHKFGLYLAITEWLAVFGILIFNTTFYWEFKAGYSVGTIYQAQSIPILSEYNNISPAIEISSNLNY